MVDNQVCVGIALFAESDSYNNILKFGTPYVVHSVYMHICIHTVLPVAKIICPVCMCC